MEKESSILVAGTDTLIGSAIQKLLLAQGFLGTVVHDQGEPDYADAQVVADLMKTVKPDVVIVAAGKSGGISANQKYSADLMIDNLAVSYNLITQSHAAGVKKLLYLASSCSYPRECEQPMKPEYLMTGPLEPTNEAYAVAKLSGIKLCQAHRAQYGSDFIVGIPANAFGCGDDFDPENSHVIAALIRRMHDAKVGGTPEVAIWGTGAARRDFIYADDLAAACLFVIQNYSEADPINLGTGMAVSIKELVDIVKKVVGYNGAIVYDTFKPDGMPMKCLDTDPLSTAGWQAGTELCDAVRATYEWYLGQIQAS